MIEPSRGPLLDNGPMIRAEGLSVGVGRVGATNQALVATVYSVSSGLKNQSIEVHPPSH